MASSEAGPSRPPASSEVHISIEPVHIYTDPDVASSSLGPPSGIAAAFERERKLQDISADGTNIFATRAAASEQLSQDVHRLWAERGDFSRFRTADLLRKRERDTSPEAQSDDDEHSPAGEEKDDEEPLLRPAAEVVGGTIGEAEFVALRNKVLANLDVAHFNSIHAHQLLGMLLKQHRAPSAAANTAAAGRMGSPAPSVGGQSARSGTNTAARAPLGIFAHLAPSSREEEFVLDPLAISLSRTALNASAAARRSARDDMDEDSDDDDPRSAGYGLKQARREMEAAAAFKHARLRDLKVVLETKRAATRNAADLLSSAAAELRASQASNRERWRALIGLHARGWRLTPGRPLLDVERFGATADEEEPTEDPEADADAGEKAGEEKKKKPAGLQGFGTPIITSDGKVKDEGARDAWIGFGLPEAPVELRRRSLAYWADASSAAAAPEEVKQKLVFPDRMHRRLRVRFVLWRATSSGEERMEWTSDQPTSSAESDARLGVGQVLDEELQSASREASDELVFGDVVAQARALPPAFGVRLTPSSVRVVLTPRLDMILELVSTCTECTGKYAAQAQAVVALVRMGVIRKFHAFVQATRLARRADASSRAAAIKAHALAVPKTAAKADTTTTLARMDSLGPLLVALHYVSFLHRLQRVLNHVQGELQQKGVGMRVQMVPIVAEGGLRAMMTRWVEAAHSQPTDLHTLYARKQRSESLHGYAKLFATTQGAERLAATITFKQPSAVTVQFNARPRAPRTKLTTDPLPVDLETLPTLLLHHLT